MEDGAGAGGGVRNLADLACSALPLGALPQRDIAQQVVKARIHVSGIGRSARGLLLSSGLGLQQQADATTSSFQLPSFFTSPTTAMAGASVFGFNPSGELQFGSAFAPYNPETMGESFKTRGNFNVFSQIFYRPLELHSSSQGFYAVM